MKTASEKSSSVAARVQRSQQSPFFSKRGEDSFFASSGVQASIEIGQPGDAYEQEADAMADKVMRQTSATGSPEKQDKEKLQTKPLAQSITPVSHTPRTHEEQFDGPAEENSELSRKEIQKAPADSATVSQALEQQIQSTKGSGAPLPAKTRQEMEEGFGADFGKVRTHTGSEAAQMSQDLGAQAFTHGQDIYFNHSKYAPETSAGKHLLAHELTHTVQQTGGGNVQKKAIVQRDKAEPDKKKSLGEATQAELDEVKVSEGYISKGNKGKIEFHIKKLKTEKYYITQEEAAWLKNYKGTQIPKGERNSKQLAKWKKGVKEGVQTKLKELAGKENEEEGKLLKLTLLQSKQKGIVGTLEQIVNEVLVPFWNYKGTPTLYDIEHMIDWQILGEEADRIDNLILLDRKVNRKLGTVVRNAIEGDLSKIAAKYAKSFIRVPTSGANVKNKYDTFIDDFDLSGKNLTFESYYYDKEVSTEKGEGNPFNKKFITLKEASIPDNHFLLTTSDKRASYVLPYTTKQTIIGAFKIDVEYDKQAKKLKSLEFTYNAPGGKSLVKAEKFKKQKIEFDEKAQDRYIIQGQGPKAILAPALKGLTIDKMSPIIINEEDIVFNGLDISVKGKVDPTLSVLKGVDISFALENNEFTVRAEVPLEKIGKNIPKPFQVDYCTIILEASTKSGLSIAGGLGFSIENLGRGDIFAKVGKTIAFDGTFSFDSRWFSKADINIGYDNGDWSIGGNLEVKADAVKGIKSAGLKVAYSKGVFSADGEAKLTVPGVDTVKLAAQFNDTGEFKFMANVTLKEMPGIKSGSVEVTVMAKKGEELKLGVKGEAEPDMPNVPSISPKLAISYIDGVFDVRATVKYKKGRFDGALEVGVTNKTVNEKGEPQGEPDQTGVVVVFGYGELTVDLFKGLTGKVSVRLTPEKQVMVAGEIVLKDLKPFGEGYHFSKDLLKFPQIQIPLVGIPGMSVSAFIDGGVTFKFDWEPLVLKELKVGFKETNLNEIEKVSLEIKGSVGSTANAELYMSINAGLKAQVLIASLSGKIGGEAGLGLNAEAGAAVDAGWNMEKGLQFKEVRAFLNVTPKAIFRLTGSVSVDLDLWVTTVNLYYHKWILAEKQIDMGALSLKIDFPIKFKEDGTLIPPEFKDMNLQKPDFSGDQGKDVLNKAINGEAEKKLEEKKQGIRNQIKADLRDPATQKEMTPTQYTKKMKGKYAKAPELQEFVVKTIEEESRNLEYEQFEKEKKMFRDSPSPLASKLNFVDFFFTFHQYITVADKDAFKAELTKLEEEKKAKASLLNTDANASSVPPVNGAPVNKKANGIHKKESPTREKTTEAEPQGFRAVLLKIGKKQEKRKAAQAEESTLSSEEKQLDPNPRTAYAESKDAEEYLLFVYDSPGNGYLVIAREETLPEEKENPGELPEHINSTSFSEENAPEPVATTSFGFPFVQGGSSPYLQNRIASSFISNDMRVYSRRAKPNIREQQPFFTGKGKATDTGSTFITKSGIQRKKETVQKAAEEEKKNQVPPENLKQEEGALQAKKKEEEPKLHKKEKNEKDEKLQKAETPKKEPEKEPEKDPVQKKAIRLKPKAVSESIQRKETENAKVASPEVEKRLLASKGKGVALPPKVLQDLNSKMKHDFSAVRIHTDAEAAAMAEEMGALAFTHGNDIYFNNGQYAPDTSTGQQLLVHELTHVVQQSKE